MKRGELVDVREDVYLLNPRGLELGSRISIHPLCYIDASGEISIGDDVSIAHGVTILSSEHSFSDPEVPIRDQPLRSLPTSIGSNVWIGAGSRILAGSRVGNRVVVGAGSVVKGVVPSGVVVAGVPARPIRDLPTA